MSARAIPRRTLSQPAGPITGIGVRSGRDITVCLLPAGPGDGLRIHRTDLGKWVPLHLDYALDLPSCTAVGTGSQDATLFLEHLMAVLHVHAITDLVVEVDGPEIPLLSGSALPWHELVVTAGTRDLEETVEPLVVSQRHRVSTDTKELSAFPWTPPTFTYHLHYDHPMIGSQSVTTGATPEIFASELAPARTFAPVEELDQAREAGLLPAGSEENCLVIYPDRYSAEPTLPEEFARHKIVDLLGDLYLLGRPIVGGVTGVLTGHADNRALLRHIAADVKM